MPTVAENASIWGGYDWSSAGEEWSEGWGGSEAQWNAVLFPRITRLLPARTILEIAPGYGRWTNYLRRHCDRLVVVDLEQECIDACRSRFAGDVHIEYHVNDGTSLALVEDASIDFVFSFDSLVHAESDVIRAYLDQLAAKLTPNGAGFFHHSNAGAFRRYYEATGILPARIRDTLSTLRIIDKTEWRAMSMTAELFREQCESAGLTCIGQELVNWDTRRTIDCLSTFTRRGSVWDRPLQLVVNRGFMAEARAVKRRAALYS